MRIRPDGAELLQATHAVIDTAIAPHIGDDRRDALRAIEKALAVAEQLFAGDVEASAEDLTALESARAAMRGELLEALPEERRYDARLVAKAIAVATRQLASGHVPDRREYESLTALLGVPAAANASPRDIRCALPSLNERLAARIRAGQADVGSTSYAATLAHLESATLEALSESNPAYRRRAPDIARPSLRATPPASLPDTPACASLAVWSDVLRASMGVGEAMCATGNAALATQADILGWFAQRLAANPRVPMVVVEAAHQAHDLSTVIADTSASFFKLIYAPFHRVTPRPANATRLP